MSGLKIGIAGGGVGGLAAAIALRQQGHDVTVFEQAKGFSRVGADINLTPNVVRAIDGLGAGAAIRERGARPTFRISRDWDTGKETSRLGMGNIAEEQYGAPQVTIHRADIINALAENFPLENIQFEKRLKALTQNDAGVTLRFEDGGEATFDVVVGADGIHSRVRSALFGEEKPRFTGVVSFRSVVPTERVKQVPEIEAFTKWWGPNPQSQIVTFPLNQGRETFVFATTGQESWTEESWTSEGDVHELRGFYKDFHADARALLDACDSTLKSALYEREPLPQWSVGTVTLLGDACHPMLPFMAQGAGMAIEDAVVLGRALTGASDREQAAQALRRYEKTRQQRTAKIQIGSRGNQWMKGPGNADWVYGYDAWNEPLAEA
ncbi:salicylate hydroxylase [Hydrogenophaga sp. Root209]|uniref:FAD-dependent monooxygenase n=1 Tax=Hydrogenophaga sp. Root209 TaxID=1736490 RepID=UPI0006F89274|nr:FAD-dependent monooxygenase [Hydrogenophaga sp. Root209]KRB99899.1 salicylate hydroxylase [Hydrogenophaga sp. Root209]